MIDSDLHRMAEHCRATSHPPHYQTVRDGWVVPPTSCPCGDERYPSWESDFTITLAVSPNLELAAFIDTSDGETHSGAWTPYADFMYDDAVRAHRKFVESIFPDNQITPDQLRRLADLMEAN